MIDADEELAQEIIDDEFAKEIVSGWHATGTYVDKCVLAAIKEARKHERNRIIKELAECGEVGAAIWLQTNGTRIYSK